MFDRSFNSSFNGTLANASFQISNNTPVNSKGRSNSDKHTSKDNLNVNESGVLLEKSLYIERNAENIAENEENEDELDRDIMSAVSEFDTQKGFLVFNPNANWKVSWDLMGFMIIFYQSIMIPYRI